MSDELGATGKFPDGKLNPTDDGELKFGITTDERGNVVINFGKPVAWFAMPPAAAIQFALIIAKHAGAKSVRIKT